ncbi:MAG: hypothetical protein LBI92_02650, partial [Azoarcus sp.]|nr:hypothetical protein [Azoarcus sp.]
NVTALPNILTAANGGQYIEETLNNRVFLGILNIGTDLDTYYSYGIPNRGVSEFLCGGVNRLSAAK